MDRHPGISKVATSKDAAANGMLSALPCSKPIPLFEGALGVVARDILFGTYHDPPPGTVTKRPRRHLHLTSTIAEVDARRWWHWHRRTDASRDQGGATRGASRDPNRLLIQLGISSWIVGARFNLSISRSTGFPIQTACVV